MRGGIFPCVLGAVLVVAAGCAPGGEPGERTGGAGAGGGLGGAVGTGGKAPVDSPYFLYTPGASAIQVDDRYVYAQGGDILKGDKRGGGMHEPMLYCPPSQCYTGDFVADGGYLYILADDELWRVQRENGAKDIVKLPWSHLLRGGIMVDETHAYTIMPGCAALTRTDKRTLEFEPERDVMYIEAEYPGDAGRTLGARSGETIVCGTPGKLFAIDEWGEGRLLAEGFRELWGVVTAGEHAYWIAKPVDSDQTTIYRVPLTGGETSVVATHTSGDIPTMRINYVPARNQIVYGTNLGIRTFTIATGILEERLRIGDNLYDLVVDEAFAYAGVGTLIDPVEPAVYWLARVPLSDLPGGG